MDPAIVDPAAVVEGWRRVADRIDAACTRAGRDRAEVRLIAVSKTKPAALVRAVLEAGHDLFGENRVQEALAKQEEVTGARWHLIGHLQRNKARHAVGRFELLHGVDNPALIAEIGKRAVAAGVTQAVLLQLNVADEETKFGAAPDALPALLEAAADTAGIRVRGLMIIPPPADRPEDNRRWFRRLVELRDQETARSGTALPELSMGMTDDFEVAVEEGATLVRVGRAIFGERG